MTLNTAGILAVFRVALRPSLLLPRISIRGATTLHTYRDFEEASSAHSPWYTLILLLPDIRDLDVKKLKAHGVVGLVLDKDNCLVRPSSRIRYENQSDYVQPRRNLKSMVLCQSCKYAVLSMRRVPKLMYLLV